MKQSGLNGLVRCGVCAEYPIPDASPVGLSPWELRLAGAQKSARSLIVVIGTRGIR